MSVSRSIATDSRLPVDCPLDRRGFLAWANAGLGGAALYHLMARDGLLAAPVAGEANDPPPHFAPKAKRAIHVYLCGGLSQVDSFDYKPILEKNHGKPLSSEERPDVFFGRIGLLRKSDWPFRQHGEC